LAAVAGFHVLLAFVNYEASGSNSKQHRLVLAEFDPGLLPHLPAVSGVDAGEQLPVLMEWLFNG